MAVAAGTSRCGFRVACARKSRLRLFDDKSGVIYTE